LHYPPLREAAQNFLRPFAFYCVLLRPYAFSSFLFLRPIASWNVRPKTCDLTRPKEKKK